MPHYQNYIIFFFTFLMQMPNLTTHHSYCYCVNENNGVDVSIIHQYDLQYQINEG